ncbi:MAG: phenylalanine--tRNA ligase subunit beta [Patescibacteria group bacterium]
MYISYNWLKDFVKIPAKVKPEAVAAGLTGHTVEVEGSVNQADQFAKVVIGQVLEVNPHPNADRLRLTVVDIKTKKLNIVCGAPNVAVGHLVPVALVGAKLPNGLEIKESLIRGEKSSGMICAEDELGLGKDHAGIMVLKDSAKIGSSFAKYLRADDIIFEIDNKSLSNRPDLLSHYGLAREVAAIFDLPLKPYEKFLGRDGKFLSAKDSSLAVKVEDADRCLRYMAVKVDNIIVRESPEWLKARLVAIGQRPVNNIVDLTNYVMFDCGQPLHAFDAARVRKIVVRRARSEEIIETLDEKERSLGDKDLVISDGDRVLAVAGIMGGRDSGVTSDTISLILEAANFSAISVRQTAQRLGLRTEASIRFEKALDPNLAAIAVRRFLALLPEICPEMKIASELVDINNFKNRAVAIDLDLLWLTEKIGQPIPRDVVVKSLEKLGFSLEKVSEETDKLHVLVPSWRATKDITSREDLAEEILRIYGYENIISSMPVQALNIPEANEPIFRERKVKDILAMKYSLSETYNYSFVGAEQLKKLNIDFFQHLRLANPLAETQTMLRQSLVPGLIGNVKANQFYSESLGFFEIGSVFFNAPGNLKKDTSSDNFLPHQEKRLGLALAGDDDVFGRLKGLIYNLVQNLFGYRREAEFLHLENVPGWADCQAAAQIKVLGQNLGLVATLDRAASLNLNLKKPVALAEINFDLLIELILRSSALRFQEAPKYPPVSRDLAFVVAEEILYNDIRRAILDFNPLIVSAELFDIYIGSKLAGGRKSLAFHILYQSPDRTLTASEVDLIQQQLVGYLAHKFEAQLRDF